MKKFCQSFIKAYLILKLYHMCLTIDGSFVGNHKHTNPSWILACHKLFSSLMHHMEAVALIHGIYSSIIWLITIIISPVFACLAPVKLHRLWEYQHSILPNYFAHITDTDKHTCFFVFVLSGSTQTNRSLPLVAKDRFTWKSMNFHVVKTQHFW